MFLDGLATFFGYVSWIVMQNACDQYQTNLIGFNGRCLYIKCSVNQRFCVCEHDMPHALEKIVIEVSNHVESGSSTIKNISSLPKCLWPPNLAQW